MPKTTSVPIPDLENISQPAYWALWDEYAKVALEAVLSFHGCCEGNATNAGVAAAEAADSLMAERAARVAAIKEAQEAEAEKEKAAGKGKK